MDEATKSAEDIRFDIRELKNKYIIIIIIIIIKILLINFIKLYNIY